MHIGKGETDSKSKAMYFPPSLNHWMNYYTVTSGGPGILSIPIRFYYRIRELNF
jgi:hypothetical protein